jgi:uncharacterized protein YbjT (DUF2867 family)
MSRVLITGATGLVGGILLRMLANDAALMPLPPHASA